MEQGVEVLNANARAPLLHLPPEARATVEPPEQLTCMVRLARWLQHVCQSMVFLVRSVLFRDGSARQPAGFAMANMQNVGSGAAFRQALLDLYGVQLQLPQFFEGSFSLALQEARRDSKLLVVYLHDAMSPHSRTICTEVLANDLFNDMLSESFFVWGGDLKRRDTLTAAQTLNVRQFPNMSVVLPASSTDIRVLGTMSGAIQADSFLALLTACVEDLETHRVESFVALEQQVEDRLLREQQDHEYQMALEVDRQRARQKELQEEQEREARQQEEERLRLECEELAKAERAKQQLQECRRQRAAELPAEDHECTARISIRLPSGQRIQHAFRPDTTLSEIYAFAEVCAYVPANQEKKLEIPSRFLLKTSFPSQVLEEMDRTIEDLKLAGSNMLLTEVEDDD